MTTCDPTEIARAIEVLLDDPRDGRKMGRNGRKLVKNQYSWRRVAKLLEDAYRDSRERQFYLRRTCRCVRVALPVGFIAPCLPSSAPLPVGRSPH